MSWATNTTKSISKAGAGDEVGTLEIPTPTLGDWAHSEAEQQFVTAVEAAKRLASVVGRPGDKIHVSMAGHANPGHSPAGGWADEMITVTVYAKPPKKEDPDATPNAT